MVSFLSCMHASMLSLTSVCLCKKFGTWECEIIRFPKPVQSEEEELPFYPIVLLAVETGSNYILPMSPVANYEERPEQLMELFLTSLVEDKVRPKIMKVRDERTFQFFKTFCEKLKISISMEEYLPSLENVEQVLWDKLNQSEESETEEILTILDTILSMDEKYLKELPDFMIEQLSAVLEKEEIFLPENVEEKLFQILDKIERSRQDPD